MLVHNDGSAVGNFYLPKIYNISNEEKSQIESLVDELLSVLSTVESNEAALACEIASSRLPRGILDLLRLIGSGYVNSSYLLIRGFDIDDEAIGDSPSHWDAPWQGQSYLREEVFQMLISSAVGGVFGWRTQENGRFLRHIVPIEAVKDEQLGGSSSTTLLWHTEEAFHPGRADFFTLMCYRNSERATTNISSIDDIALSESQLDVLRQNRFVIMPDKSHTPVENNSDFWKLNSDAFSIIQEMIDNPRPVSLLYGRKGCEMMRVDQAFAFAVVGDEEASAVLASFHNALDETAVRLVMEPGDVVLLDNFRVAHGRSIYKPDYGPRQRWMRRVNIANGRRSMFNLRDSEKPRVML